MSQLKLHKEHKGTQKLSTRTNHHKQTNKISNAATIKLHKFSQVLNETRQFMQYTLTFLIVLQKEVEVAKLTEYICVNFPLTLKDECIVAANSLCEPKK